MLHHFQWIFLRLLLVSLKCLTEDICKLCLAYPRSCDYKHVLRIKIQAKKGTVEKWLQIKLKKRRSLQYITSISKNIKNFSESFCSCVFYSYTHFNTTNYVWLISMLFENCLLICVVVIVSVTPSYHSIPLYSFT